MTSGRNNLFHRNPPNFHFGGEKDTGLQAGDQITVPTIDFQRRARSKPVKNLPSSEKFMGNVFCD